MFRYQFDSNSKKRNDGIQSTPHLKIQTPHHKERYRYLFSNYTLSGHIGKAYNGKTYLFICLS